MSHELMVNPVSFVQKCVNVGNSLEQRDRYLRGAFQLHFPLVALSTSHLLKHVLYTDQVHGSIQSVLHDNPTRWQVSLYGKQCATYMD